MIKYFVEKERKNIMDYIEMWEMRKKQIFISSLLSLVAAVLYMIGYDYSELKIALLIWAGGACAIGVIWSMIANGNPFLNVVVGTLKSILSGLIVTIFTPLGILLLIPAFLVLSVAVGLFMTALYFCVLIYPISTIYYLIRYNLAIHNN